MHLYATASALRARTANLLKYLYARIAKLGLRHAFIFVVLSFLAGQGVNIFAPLHRFLEYQLLFIPAVVIAFGQIKVFVADMEKYKAMIASHPTRDTGLYVSGLL